MFEEFLQIKDSPQYVSTFLDGTVVSFRLLTYNEYALYLNIQKVYSLTDNLFYEEIFNICAAQDYKNIGGRVRAGIPESIGRFIWEQSFTYDYIESEIETARLKYKKDELYEQMKMVVIRAFNQFKVTDLDNLDRHSLINLFVRAENYLENTTYGDNKYSPVNTKRMRNQSSSKIDFRKENRELLKEFGNTELQSESPGRDLKRMKEQTIKARQTRLNK